MHPFVSFGGGGILLQRRSGGFLWINSFRSLADHFFGRWLWQPNFVIEIFAISTFPSGIMVTKVIHVWLNRLGAGLTIIIIGTSHQSLPPTLSEIPNFIWGGPFDSLTIFLQKNETPAHKSGICQIFYFSKIPKINNFT